ncbi:MAG: L-threonylcarbamoyladenylate synthase, partial [Candidatus Marinimicrobia bacterium]|nr:L-threonylcarbamoyladenylate synthase [Candidatus Neomarinimicrobiota bacterium]
LKSGDPKSTTTFTECLAAGGLAVYPTDTLYGLGVAADNGDAIKRLERLKGRGGPFSVMAGSLSSLEKILLVHQEDRDKIRHMLPGPYAIIGPARFAGQWHASLLGPDDTLSVRIGDHPWLKRLFANWEKTMITTSVNRTTEPALQSPGEIVARLGDDIDLLIDGGVLAPSKGSTMLKIGAGQWQLLRQGDGAWPL